MLHIRPHSDDAMTPVQRLDAIRNNKPYDRLPVSLFVGEIKAPLYGVTMDKLVTSVEDMVNAEIYIFNRFGADTISCGPNSYGIAAAMGADVIFPEDSSPKLTKDLITDYAQCDNLGIFNPETTWPVNNRYEALKILSEEAKGIVPVTSSVGGTMTIASYLRGAENLLKDLRKNPEGVWKLLNAIMDCQKRCIDVFSEYGVTISIGDPISSGSLLSPKLFREFSLPCLKEISDYAYEKTSKMSTLHICGNTTRIWDDIKDLKLVSYSIDEVCNLGDASDFFGDKMSVVGNIPPIEVMYEGDAEKIDEAVKENVNQAYDLEKGYWIAFGCDIPPGAPHENLDYFMASARHYGSYDYVNALKTS